MKRSFLGHRLLPGEQLRHGVGDVLPPCRLQGGARELDEWLRRTLRCVRLKQCKRTHPIAVFLMKGGVSEKAAWMLAFSGKGWWRLSRSTPVSVAMTSQWFKEQAHHVTLQPAGNRRVRCVRSVV
jgi:hypothetical protein